MQHRHELQCKVLVHEHHHSLLSTLHTTRVHRLESCIKRTFREGIDDEHGNILHLCRPIYLAIQLNIENLELRPRIFLEGLLKISSSTAKKERNIILLNIL